MDWIGLRGARRGPVFSVTQVLAEPLSGLIGDYPSARTLSGPVRDSASARQVTLIQTEHLPAIASLAGRTTCPPELLRRNLTVTGIPLLALNGRQFRIGSDAHGWVLLEGTGECLPCPRMEEALGPGGYNAVRGHGGITARILQGGVIHIGAQVEPAD